MPGPSKHEHHGRKPHEVDLDGVRPEVDVITKHRRRLVPVHRAADVGQDADVVQGGQFIRVESEPGTQAHPYTRRAGHVFGRLTESEVGGQRERDHQVREAYARVAHAAWYRS